MKDKQRPLKFLRDKEFKDAPNHSKITVPQYYFNFSIKNTFIRKPERIFKKWWTKLKIK